MVGVLCHRDLRLPSAPLTYTLYMSGTAGDDDEQSKSSHQRDGMPHHHSAPAPAPSTIAHQATAADGVPPATRAFLAVSGSGGPPARPSRILRISTAEAHHATRARSCREACRASTLDGVRDLQGDLAGGEVRGVDDLGLAVQPGAGRLGVGLEVFQTE